MKPIATSFFGYHSIDRSRHSDTNYLNDEKGDTAFNNELFKRLVFIYDQLYEVELVKCELDHKEPIFVRFFISTDRHEEIEIDTDSLYLAITEKDLVVSKKEKSKSGNRCEAKTASTASLQMLAIFLSSKSSAIHKKHDKREPKLFGEEFRSTEMLCLCIKAYCCSNNFEYNKKGLNKPTFEVHRYDLMGKYQKIFEEKEIVTSTNRGFRTKSHSVVT